MTSLLNNPKFADAFARLGDVTLNPRRHTAANARAHSEAVAARAGLLARQNACSEAEVSLLEDLGRAHDIGKITGTAKPERSLAVLAECGIDATTHPALLPLVKWHDTNLPWYLAHSRGQPPSDKAWRRLANELDMRHLALFMVADRVDAPPGWRRNAPLVWFLDEARKRELVPASLALDVPGQPSEISAGAALVANNCVLVIRVRSEGYELPKGGIEWDELPEDAALRELREEAAVASPVRAGSTLGHLDYTVATHAKRVYYVTATCDGAAELGPLPSRTRERRWISANELPSLPLVNEELRPLLARALTSLTIVSA
jgi:ADP-ribose pyrophosphatase YjhB (NUDIX family)